MNQQLQDFARAKILEGLSKLPSEWQDKFKLMYGRDGGKRNVDDTRALPIADVVRDMPADTLDGALTQVDNSLAKLPPSPEPRRKLVSYAETGYPLPAATGASDPLDEVVGWVCVHKDGGEPQLLGLDDRKIANQRMKLPNTWQLHPVTIRGAVQPSPAWCAALNKWALHRVRCAH